MNWCEKSDGGEKTVMCIVTGNFYGMVSGASPREFLMWHGGGLTTLKEEGAEHPC